MKKENNFKKPELAYYLTLYTLEGHETWRAHLGSDTGSFQRAQNAQLQGRQPKVLIKNVIRIDRLTGTIKPYENNI